MKFPPFEYLRAGNLQEAIAVLSSDDDAKVLAGGQSLLPLMALRLARPSILVDITGLELAGMEVLDASPHIGGRVLRVGAMTRQRQLEADPAASAVPLLAAAIRHVGHPATRNQGTVGGSLAHADPAAELPAVAVTLGAVAVAAGPSGTRPLRCADLAAGYFTTSLAADEILTEIHFPVPPEPVGAAFCEWAPRAGDFAEVGVGVALRLDDQARCAQVWAGACGLGSVPVDLGPVLAGAGLLGEGSMSPALLRVAAGAVREAAAGGGDDKSDLAGLLTARAVRKAFADATAKIGAVA